MSKIGRKPIALLSAKVEIKGNEVSVIGSNANFVHVLPKEIGIDVRDGYIYLSLNSDTNEGRAMWGLHRALLGNKVLGAQRDFEKKVKIVGLGYKAQLSGRKINFSLGYSHKIDYDLPDGVNVDIDKTGQQLIFKSSDKLALGNACDAVRRFRPPEPYKGTGIIVEGEVVIRKAGKTKAS